MLSLLLAMAPPDPGPPIPVAPPIATLAMRGDDVVPIVSGTIHGKRIWFGLDTGATGAVLDSDLAKSLGIEAVEQTEVSGAGLGSIPASYLAAYDIGLGATHYHATRALSIGLSRPGIPAVVRGVLGMPFFLKYVIDVDYVAHRVTLYDPRTFDYRGGGASIPVHISDNRAFTPVAVGNSSSRMVQHTLLIDTGSSSIVNDDIVYTTKGPKSEERSSGLGQARHEIRGTIPNVRIGPYSFTDVISIGGGVNMVGSNFWNKFHTVYDFPHRRIFLEPSQALLDGR